MKLATISQAKNQFSAFIELVRHGETVIVTDRDRPVARIEPIIASSADDDDARLVRLERAGVIRRGEPRAADEQGPAEPPVPQHGGDVLAALIADRDESR